MRTCANLITDFVKENRDILHGKHYFVTPKIINERRRKCKKGGNLDPCI